MQFIGIEELVTEIPKLFWAKEPMMILGRPAIGKFPAPLEVDRYLYRMKFF